MLLEFTEKHTTLYLIKDSVNLYLLELIQNNVDIL